MLIDVLIIPKFRFMDNRDEYKIDLFLSFHFSILTILMKSKQGEQLLTWYVAKQWAHDKTCDCPSSTSLIGNVNIEKVATAAVSR